MAMLAERKVKQKWSQDPRNKTWSTDTDRFGYQMLTKMGWSDGKGLGASESGSTSHVKISLKNDNLGVGAKVSHDDNWLAHQDDFNNLLAHLNSENNTGISSEDQSSKNDMESIARKSKKRVFYERFIKSKNTSSYSATDMACILGQRSKSAPDSPVDQSEDEDSDGSCASCPASQTSNSLGLTIINSSQSVQEYFAMKMAELKKKRQQSHSNIETTLEDPPKEKQDELNCDLESNVQRDKTKKKRKQKSEESNKKKTKNSKGNSEESSLNYGEKGEQCMGSENDNKKKKDKKRKREENEEGPQEVVEKKRKKKSKGDYTDNPEESTISKKGKKKEKKKVKNEQIEIDSTTVSDNSEKRSSKKAKKSKSEAKVTDFEETDKSKDDKKSKKMKKQASNRKFCEDGQSNESKKKSKTKKKTKKV